MEVWFTSCGVSSGSHDLYISLSFELSLLAPRCAANTSRQVVQLASSPAQRPVDEEAIKAARRQAHLEARKKAAARNASMFDDSFTADRVEVISPAVKPESVSKPGRGSLTQKLCTTSASVSCKALFLARHLDVIMVSSISGREPFTSLMCLCSCISTHTASHTASQTRAQAPW
jgi:hypothetical protein